MKSEDIRKVVKSGYARVALESASCCRAAGGCCGGVSGVEEIGRRIGYGDEEFNVAPEGANLGLGCGNPVAFASIKEGDIVLDLGSGAGFDCFIAAAKVGSDGRVIGVDMTPEMVEKAERNARKAGVDNVEFRLGEIENLPVPDEHVDLVISNCVINLSPEKGRVFREAWRVLKPGGRLMISDMVLLKELPEVVRRSVEAYVGCIAGAVMKEEYLAAIGTAGFKEIEVLGEDTYPLELIAADSAAGRAMQTDLSLTDEEAENLSGAVASIKVSARKAGP